MFRLLFLLAFVFWPVTSSTDTGARDPLTREHETAFTDAMLISPLIQKRFALYAAMAHCDHMDNQYAYNVVLKRFAQSERYILRKAAEAGWKEGVERAAADTGPCEVAIDRLRAADDALLARAELMPAR